MSAPRRPTDPSGLDVRAESNAVVDSSSPPVIKRLVAPQSAKCWTSESATAVRESPTAPSALATFSGELSATERQKLWAARNCMTPVHPSG